MEKIIKMLERFSNLIKLKPLWRIIFAIPIVLVIFVWPYFVKYSHNFRIEYIILIICIMWIYFVWAIGHMFFFKKRFKNFGIILFVFLGFGYIFYDTREVLSLRYENIKSKICRDSEDEMEIIYPKTVNEAVNSIIELLDKKTRLSLANEIHLSGLHHGFGTFIRNKLGMWNGNIALLMDCGHSKYQAHPDHCSSIIISKIHKKLKLKYMKMDRLGIRDKYYNPGELTYDVFIPDWDKDIKHMSKLEKQLFTSIIYNDLKHLKFVVKQGVVLDIKDTKGKSLLEFGEKYLSPKNMEEFKRFLKTGKWNVNERFGKKDICGGSDTVDNKYSSNIESQ